MFKHEARKVGPALALVVILAACANPNGRDRLTLHGNIEMTEVEVSFQRAGKIVELAVNEGDFVDAGQVMARLEKETLERQKEQAEAAQQTAEMQLAQAQAARRLRRETVAGEIELRRAEVGQARAVLEELQAGSRQQEIEQAAAAVQEVRTRFHQAGADWERAQTLYRQDDISRSQHDQFQTAYESTAAALRQAEQRLALVREGPRKEQLDEARARLRRQEAALRLAESQEIDLERLEKEILARRAEVERAAAQVRVLEQQIAETVAAAPVGGVVLVKAAEIGEVVSAATAVLTLADLDRPWLRGYVNETDLGRIQLGGDVTVTTDSFPGRVYPGKISFIASEAEFTPKTIQTTEERVKLVYRIKIDLRNERHELKLNMPVDAEIQLHN